MNGIALAIREAVTSKKFVAAVAGTICAGALKIGLDLPVEDVATVLAPILLYIFAQGWADKGKGAAKVDAIASVAANAGASPTKQVEAIKEA